MNNGYRCRGWRKVIYPELMIAWIAMSVSRKQIATNLGISIRTIDFYVPKIREMCGGSDTATITRYAIKWGLLPFNEL